MNPYDDLCKEIKKGKDSLLISMLAISYWVIKAIGMSGENLQSIMFQLGFAFNTTTAILTTNETSYTIYELIDYCIQNLYKFKKVLNPASVDSIIKYSYEDGYLTLAQKDILDSALGTILISDENI